YRREKLEVLLLTDTLDSFMLAGLQNYEGFPLKNVASAEVEASPQASDKADADALPQAELDALLARFKAQLGERITDARASDRLVDSPLRLVAPADARDAEMDRVRRFLDKEYSVPKRIVEINPKHPLIKNLSARLQAGDSDALVADAIEQLYANGLLLEGLHPNPAEMVGRIQALMEAAVRR
ncbi:MAG: molecular chaperone HtpG, partial [Roseiflexaceae bacterium]|nr:molecular chaperone HtpG [Roseiflexaceae bacterium]